MNEPLLPDPSVLERTLDSAVASARLDLPAGDSLLDRLRDSAALRRRYLFFLKWMDETFHAVAECFPPGGSGGGAAIDAAGAGTSAHELLYLANHLFLTHHAGVPGVVLECGCFKGFSACCLSHACAALGRRLVVADSFAGLPDPGAEGGGYYRRGDFRGARAEVEENLAACGRPEVTTLVEGWFSESLTGWREPIALAWLDVDLAASARDVLARAGTRLEPGGALFCHEFRPESVVDGRIAAPDGPAAALREHLERHRLPYTARFLAGWLGMVSFERSVAPWSPRLLDALLPSLRDADHRARVARAAGGRPAWPRRVLARLAGMRRAPAADSIAEL